MVAHLGQGALHVLDHVGKEQHRVGQHHDPDGVVDGKHLVPAVPEQHQADDQYDVGKHLGQQRHRFDAPAKLPSCPFAQDGDDGTDDGVDTRRGAGQEHAGQQRPVSFAVLLEQVDEVLEREVSFCQSVSSELDQRGRGDGEVRDADGKDQHQHDERPGENVHARGKDDLFLFARRGEVVAVRPGQGVLLQPEDQADDHQKRREGGGSAEADRRDGGVPVDLGGEDVVSDTSSQRRRGAVFGERLDEHQQRPDGVRSGEQGKEDLSEAKRAARSAQSGRFRQAGRDGEHGVFQHGHQKREDVQAHHQHQTGQGEEPVLRTFGERKHLLQEPALLHEQDPTHRRDVRRRHERDHEDDVKRLHAGEFGRGEQECQGIGEQGGDDDHQDAEQQRREDHPDVFFLQEYFQGSLRCGQRFGKDGKKRQDDKEHQNGQHDGRFGASVMGRNGYLAHSWFSLAAVASEILAMASQSVGIWGISDRLVRLVEVTSERPGIK